MENGRESASSERFTVLSFRPVLRTADAPSLAKLFANSLRESDPAPHRAAAVTEPLKKNTAR
jgi:hypothetical protein